MVNSYEDCATCRKGACISSRSEKPCYISWFQSIQHFVRLCKCLISFYSSRFLRGFYVISSTETYFEFLRTTLLNFRTLDSQKMVLKETTHMFQLELWAHMATQLLNISWQVINNSRIHDAKVIYTFFWVFHSWHFTNLMLFCTLYRTLNSSKRCV